MFFKFKMPVRSLLIYENTAKKFLLLLTYSFK